MARETRRGPHTLKPRVEIPPYVPATPEEIARRRALAEEVDRLRETMPIVARDAADLVREDRDEHEEEHG